MVEDFSPSIRDANQGLVLAKEGDGNPWQGTRDGIYGKPESASAKVNDEDLSEAQLKITEDDLLKAVEEKRIKEYLTENGLPLQGPKLDKFLAEVFRKDMIFGMQENGNQIADDAQPDEIARAYFNDLLNTIMPRLPEDVKAGLGSDNPVQRKHALEVAGRAFAEIAGFSKSSEQDFDFVNPLASYNKALERYKQSYRRIIDEQN